jgi:hypothetical protein
VFLNAWASLMQRPLIYLKNLTSINKGIIMKKLLTTCLGLVIAAAAFASPLTAKCNDENRCENRCEDRCVNVCETSCPANPGIITNSDLAGTYQFSGFSNSTDGVGSPVFPQSQAVVGQAIINADGTALITFIDLTAVINNQIVHIHRNNVLATYGLGPVNGQLTIQIFDFPAAGANPVFTASVKTNCGKVTGFSFLTALNSVPTRLWTLVQAERIN